MEPHVALGLEQRLADLEAHIDRLNVALGHWHATQDHLQPVERRLAGLTDQCADILKQWSATGERHAQAVGELEARLTGWNDVESRLQREASWRFQALERAIGNEWASLRHVHEEPARQLRTQAETLTEICVATAGSAQTGLERAEARLATLERELHRRMDDLSRDLHTVVAELRLRGERANIGSPANTWSLDEVARLHHELREGQGARAALPEGPVSIAPDKLTPGLASRTTSSLFGSTTDVGNEETTVESFTATNGSSTARDEAFRRSDWKWFGTLAVLTAGLLVAVVFAMSFYRKADTAAARASEAQEQAEQVATTASREIAAVQQEAAAKIVQAAETASRAQLTGDVLAASDLIRFNLTGGDSVARFSGQVLWSRSRGMIFSASRLPAPPAASTYQIWLLTAGDPVSGGTFVPDVSGRASTATSTPTLPRPILGVQVTLEPAPGSTAPSGAIVLARPQ